MSGKSIGAAADTLPDGRNAYDVANEYLSWQRLQNFEDKKNTITAEMNQQVFEKISA